MKHTWRQWFWKALAGATRRSGAGRRRVHLTLETLEDRTVPSGVSPYVQAIDRTSPAGPATNASTVVYTVVFNTAVTGVNSNDFALALGGTAAATQIAVTPVSSAVYTVTVSGITGGGTLGLNLVDNGSIHDLAGDPLGQANPITSFASQATYAMGAFPRSVALADVNGDGHLDLIAANSVGNSVNILLGNGDGTFQSPPALIIQNTFAPRSVVVTDLSGDGIPDLVVANIQTNNLSVFLGNGDGTFQNPTTIATGAGPEAVAAADLNGDGLPDLVVANVSRACVGVFLGNGDGTFQAQQTFATGGIPIALAVADVNGDGIPDLVVANNVNPGTVSVLLGNGDGTFQAQQTFAVGESPEAVAVADLNGDGKPDLVVASYYTDSVRVLVGNGDGTFQQQSGYPVGVHPDALAVADVNGDGHLDLIVANAVSNNVSVLVGNGDGTFQNQTTFATGQTPIALAVADLNGDGRPDLVVANYRDNTASVLLNADNGNFQGQVYNVADPAVPTQFVVSAAPNGTTAGSNLTFTVTAEDQFNETSFAYTGTVAISSSDTGASTVLPADATLTSGVGIFSVTLTTAGTQTLMATDTATSSITGASAITVNGAQATHLAVSAGGTATAGRFFAFTVTAQDQYNNTANNYVGTVDFSGSDPQATFSDPSTLTAGVGVFDVIWTTAGNQTLAATDTATSSLTGTSATIAVNAGAVAHFAVRAPGTATAGSAFDFAVTAQDQFNNTATDYTGTVQFTSSDGAGLLPANSTLTSGVGTFSATLRTAAAQTLTATDTTTASTTGNSVVTVLQGAATHFLIAASPSATAGSPTGFVVTAQDQFNNTATTYTGAVHITSSDGQAALPVDATLTSGMGFFAAELKTAGNQTFTASDALASISGISNSITVSAAAAVRLVMTAAAPTFYPGVASAYPTTPGAASSFANSGAAVVFTVAAQDAFGNIAQNYGGTVAFASSDPAAGVVLPPPTTLTGGLGIFSATLVTPGNQAISAADSATPGITAATTDVVIRGLVVTSFTPTPTGFSITFNKPFNPSTVIMYTPTGVQDDIMLTTSSTQVSVRGSVLINPADTSITFVKTASASALGSFNPAAGLLAAGQYTVTLRSFHLAPGESLGAISGFQDALGGALDGTDTADPGTNYVLTFSVSAPPTGVGIPDFARGPSNTDALFLPATIGNGNTFNLIYTNPNTTPTTGTATVTFSTTPATLLNNIQNALSFTSNSAGGLADQIGVSGGNVPNSAVVVTNDRAAGANVLVTFQNALATATDQLLSSSTPGVTISLATINAANNVPGNGIPIALSSGQGVTSGSFTLQYNPSLLQISGAVPSAAISAIDGALFTLVSNTVSGTVGTAVLSLSSPSRISSTTTAITLGSLLATVPMSATASYGAKQLLHFSSEQLNGTAGPVAVTNQDGVQVAAYLGDVVGAGGPFSLGDATAISAVAGGIASTVAQTIPGFATFPDLDPAIIGDVSLAGTVNFADATLMNQQLVSAQVKIPYAPIGLPVPPVGPDPTLSVGYLAPGDSPGANYPAGNVIVPVNIDTARPPGSTGMVDAMLALAYDPKVFDVLAADVRLGTVPEGGTGWQLNTEVNAQAGLIGVELFSTTPIQTGAGGSLVTIAMHLRENAPAGTGLTLVPDVDPGGGPRVYQTSVADGQGEFVIHMNGGQWTVDGRTTLDQALDIGKQTSDIGPGVDIAHRPSHIEPSVGILEQVFGDLVPTAAYCPPLPADSPSPTAGGQPTTDNWQLTTDNCPAAAADPPDGAASELEDADLAGLEAFFVRAAATQPLK